MRLNPRCAKRSIANWPRPQRLTAKRVWTPLASSPGLRGEGKGRPGDEARTPHAGDTLLLRAEHGNTVDRFAVAVVKGSNIVGHVVITREYSSSVRLADLDVCLK